MTSPPTYAYRQLDPAHADYPPRLRELPDPPSVLYAAGSFDHAISPAVAIVGTRAASAYGLRVTRSIATACANAGISVVSGLARGIDGAAHVAALAAGGRTVGVLGTGIHVNYPQSHRELQSRIARDGLLLSELPPTSTGHRGSFPMRNRLIAALADVTVVIEAGEKSGALITAEQAVALGRTVACVPNAIDALGSVGSNALLKSGAEPILSSDDVLALLQLRAMPSPLPALEGDCASCWDAIRHGARDVASVARIAGITGRAATVALSTLEIEGLVTVDAIGGVSALVTASAS